MEKMPIGVLAKANDSHIAILGKTGSGKSNTAKWMAEQLLDAGERVCAIDPTGTWWGLRLNKKGGKSKYTPIIFGGEHADIAILPEHGAAIAEAIGTSSDSAIIDLRGMTVSGRTRFMTAFTEALLQKNKGKLHLILDEAHLFAPQGRVNDPQSGAMLSATNNLVSLGRGNGIRITMISQRPAKLHKDSLTQCETLIAMRLIAPQDRAAIFDWVGEWADTAKGKEIVGSLPSLPVGDGWVWAPEQNYLDLIHFGLVKTLDTGRPQEDGFVMLTMKIDVDAVTARLETIAADVVANDPRRLKQRVADLEKALEKAKATTQADPQLVEDARNGGYTAGWDKGVKETGKRLGQMMISFAADFALASAGPIQNGDDRPELIRPPKAVTVVKAKPAHESGYTTMPSVSAADPDRAQRISESGITGPQTKILNALAVWRSLGHAAPTREMVAALAGYPPTSSGFRNPLGELRASARIEYPESGKIRMLVDWYPVSLEEAKAILRQRLTGPQAKILNALIGDETLTRGELAFRAGYPVTSSGFRNPLGELRTLGMIDYPGTGEVKKTEWLAGLLG